MRSWRPVRVRALGALLVYAALASPGAAGAARGAALTPPSAQPAFCVTPADCGASGACVAGLCRSGAARALVRPLYALAVPPVFALADDARTQRAARALTDQLRADLAWSGFYTVLEEEHLPGAWAREGMSPAETQRTTWQMARVARVVHASVRPGRDEGALRVAVRVFEVERFGTAALPFDELTVRPGGLRAASAEIANALVAVDTGIPGVAGARLAVSAEVRRGVKEIATLGADGAGLAFVTRNGSLNLDPAWGPGGSVGYMSYRSGNADWVVDGRTFSARRGMNAVGAWSPDGGTLALSISEGENTDIYLLDGRTGAELSRLTDHPAVDTSPTWAPDGGRIAFVSDRAGSPNVWTVDLRTGDLKRLTGGYTTTPSWAPQGHSLVYAQMVGAGFVLMLRDLDTGATQRLTPGGASSESPAWSPCGRYIAFVRREGDARRLWIMDSDGARQRPLASTIPYPLYAPTWRRLASPLTSRSPTP